jgi:hypothetical protein
MPEYREIELTEKDAALLDQLAGMEGVTDSQMISKLLTFWVENL